MRVYSVPASAKFLSLEPAIWYGESQEKSSVLDKRYKSIAEEGVCRSSQSQYGPSPASSQLALSSFSVVTPFPVLFSDLDPFGHVNNLTYLRWCENARVEYLQRIEMWTDFPPSGAGPIIANVSCDYKAQVKHPDTVHVGSRAVRIGNSSLQMEHIVFSQERSAVVAFIRAAVVWIDYARGKPITIPADIRRRISDLEGWSDEGLAVAAAAGGAKS